MAEFRQGIITARGLDLLAKAQAGTANITFTRAIIGNGEWASDTPMETIMQSVALRNARGEFPVRSAEFVNEATSLLTVVARNTNTESGYYITEVGVYATDGETEVLYAVYLATVPDWLPAFNGVTPFFVTYSCYITVANAESVMVIQSNMEIDDTAGDGDTDKVWSASKTSRAISAAYSTSAQTTRYEIAFLKNILKTELLQLLQHVVYTDNNSITYYNAFRDALDRSLINLSSISAVFDSGTTMIYDSMSLNSLKQYLTVTGTYSDNSTVAIDSNDYTLSGTLTVGTSTITVSYNNKTTTFTVSVAESPTLSSISASFNPGSTVIYESTSLDSLKQYLTITGAYSDNSTATIDSNDYTLSGTLIAGTSTVTVSYNNKTTTFIVSVVASATLSSISASFNPGSAVIYESTSLNSLKQYLTVTGTYSDNSTATIAANDYALSGTLTAGTSTVTVTHNGKTTTFTVTVVASATLSSISAVFNPGSTVIYESTSLNSLKQYLTVTGTYSDNSTATIDSNDYTLSGTLTAGTSTVTVSYDGKTTTFTVTVSNNVYTAQAIYTNYAPNGERFSTGNISIDFAGGDYVEAVIDASSADVVSQTNLISIAQDGSNDYLDYSTGEAVLVYKRDQSGTMKVLIRVKDTANNVAIDKWVVPNDFSNLVIKLDKNGVYLDGTAISGITASNLAFLTGQSTIAIGARASKLSYATYSSVTVYRVQ